MADDSLAACLAEIKAHPGEFYVYILSKPDGTPFYVGKGGGIRIVMHERQAKTAARSHKLSVIRKIWADDGHVGYGIVAFYSDERDALAKEVELIKTIGRVRYGGPLTNVTDGGDGVIGLEITPEMRANLRAAMTGKKKTPEHIAKVAASNRGRVRGPEFSERLSNILRSPDINAKLVEAWSRRGPMSEETRAKISTSKTGSKASAETRAKMSAARMGRKPTPETRVKLSIAAKAREEAKRQLREA